MRSTSHFLDDLNTAQRQAVEHGVGGRGANIGGPLLVIAGAGSGKTNVLAHRVANLVINGADPRRLLLLTFTRRAAQEMRRRSTTIVAKAQGVSGAGKPVQLPWAGTFHSVGARLLRTHARRIGLNPSFTIHDRDDSADLMDMVRQKLGFSDLPDRFPKKATCVAIYSRCVNAGDGLGKVLKAHFPWCRDFKRQLRELFEAYVAAKQSQHVLDFDDLLLYWAELLADPDLAHDIGGRFDHVLVDEYQDTNALQAKILQRLKPDGRGVMVVGDDAQAIYSFRAAEVRNILDFPNQFSPPATVIALEQNYRSTQRILRASNAVMMFAAERL